MFQNLSSAAVMIGALMVKQKTFSCVFLQALFKSLSTILLQFMQNIFFKYTLTEMSCHIDYCPASQE